MPQLILEIGLARGIIFKWLDNHPFARPRDLRNEFRLGKKVLADYHYQWRQLHKYDEIKKDLIFLFHLMNRKMIPKGQVSMDEREILFHIEGLVLKYEKELGFARNKKDVMDILVEKGQLVPMEKEEKVAPKRLMY